MAVNKTPNLGLHDWLGTEYVKREEIVENFRKIDDEFGENGKIGILNKKTDGIVSVKEFGAKGDGVTDDTTAIQNSLNYALTNNLPLYFPAGNYKFSQPITLTNKAKLYGSSKGTNLKYEGNGFGITTPPSVNTYDIEIENLTITCLDNNDGINLNGIMRSSVKNINVLNGRFLIDASLGAYFNEFKNIFIYSPGRDYAFKITSTTTDYATASFFFNVHVIGYRSNYCESGIVVEKGKGLVFIKCYAEYCNTLYKIQDQYNTLINCSAEYGNTGFDLTSSSSNSTLIGCTSFNCDIPLNITNSFNHTIIGGSLPNKLDKRVSENIKITGEGGGDPFIYLDNSSRYRAIKVQSKFSQQKTFLVRNETDGNDMFWCSKDGWLSAQVIQIPSGSTRPTSVPVGTIFFDTTINKLITWNGTAWKDAMGNTV